MSHLHRLTIKFAGESGQGINSTGEIITRALKFADFNTFAYREYPSLIQGGYASYQVDISQHEINSSSQYANVLVCISPKAIGPYLSTIADNGVLIHSVPELVLDKEQQEMIKSKNISVHYVNAVEIAVMQGGKPIMANVAIMGIVWKLMDQPLEHLLSRVKDRFSHKPELVDANLKVLEAGYSTPFEIDDTHREHLILTKALNYDPSKGGEQKDDYMVMTGNDAIALGALSAGLRAFYAYPMTPSTSILKFLADTYKETGVLIKQAEDEITAVQMTIGSMHMGTRAMVATSGGGFDLMTESISLAGITETPLVVVLAQRPGPATGLPTWTAAGDLEVAVYGGHGEYPKCVISVSDPIDAYTLTQEAFNIAEEFQIPVILLTEKQIAESLFLIKELPKPTPIKRGLTEETPQKLLKSSDRYKITDLGISPRWLPGQSEATFKANSDEHDETGYSIEEAQPAKKMLEKRMRKLETLRDKLPEPVLHGNKDSDTIFVGWGSVKNTVLDVLQMYEGDQSYAYLHYEYLYPLKLDLLAQLHEEGKKIVLVENNQTGQLGKMIRQNSNITFHKQLLKYDGRPFFIEDILDFINA